MMQATILSQVLAYLWGFSCKQPLRRWFLLFGLTGLAVSCTQLQSSGTLVVHYVGEGQYEIYRLANENPLQFTSETSNHFNNPVHLTAGSYLILSDCSSELVNVYPGSRTDLVAHQVNFIPMTMPQDSDKFSVQCLQFERTHSRQSLKNRFSLAVLAGTRELLVGMNPLRLDLPRPSKGPIHQSNSQVISHILSSITVDVPSKLKPNEFFVSPVGGVTPNTESQISGSKLYVLKGKYEIQLNGTETTLDLNEGEARRIVAATFRLSTSPHANLKRAEQIKGSPLYVELNGEHFFELNTTYPILPGKIDIRMSTALRPVSHMVSEGENLSLHARNIVVELGCKENDWSCLGSRKVRLFERDKNFHFSESVTDAPLLFLEKEVALGIEGSRNIKQVISGADDIHIKVGFLEITPKPSYKAGVLTDLLRVESAGQTFGSSLDLTLDKPSLLPLFVGSYHLAQYSFFTSDGSRRKNVQSVYIRPGETVPIEVPTFISEKKMALIQGTSEEAVRQ